MAEEKNVLDKFATLNSKTQPNLALFVGSLSERTDQAAISKYFSKFGEIGGVNLISDWTTGASKCCAIVLCKRQTTQAAILAAPKHVLDGKRIRVTLAEPDRKGTKKISTNCLFVGNISTRTKETEMREIFNKFGTITELKFFRNASTKANTKNCIVEYSDSQAVESAFKTKDSKEMAYHGFRISPLKHKTPTKKEKNRNISHLNLTIKPTSDGEEDMEMEMPEEAELSFSLTGLSPIPGAGVFSFGYEESPVFANQGSGNKDSGLWSTGATASRSRSASRSHESGPGCLVTLADLTCDDDLARAFFSSSPFLGQLRPFRHEPLAREAF